ncbi:hypothetical protein EPUL_005650, partial [Erysiphe pulchra]
MVVQPIRSKAELDIMIKTHEYVVIDAYATWCGPCRNISPIFESLSNRVDRVKFFKVDVDDAPDVAEALGIRAMPTFIFFRNGEKVDEIKGASPGTLESVVRSFVGSSA